MSDVKAANLEIYMKRGMVKRVAEALDLSQPTVSQWKHGIRPVPDEHIDKVCEILGVTKEDLSRPINPIHAGKNLDRILLEQEVEDVSEDELLLVRELLRKWKQENRRG